MELNERILEIMENSGLTPSEFADKIDVQRSAISHIASGRNKPSLDFLLKIKDAFPEIDTDWLFLGQKTEAEKTESEKPSDSSPTLFDLPEEEKETQNLHEPKIVTAEEPKPEIEYDNTEVTDKKASSKNPVRVIIFFEDGTFEDFMPGK